MIRRDYLLRQIEEFAAILSKIIGLTKNEEWKSASENTEQEFQRLMGMDAAKVVRLSETELLARMMQGEPVFVVENKIFMLAALLKAHGDVLTGQGRLEESREYYLKGLHLLLDVFGRSEITERPDFVPAVEAFVIGLGDSPMPVQTCAMLMRHYERTGELGKAEDMLYAILDSESSNPELRKFGENFYQRMLEQSDEALLMGNLPRAEVEAGLAELRVRK